MWSRLVVALVLVLLTAPAVAGAATVEFTYGERDYGGTYPYVTSSFRVLGDEGSDDLRITYMGGGALDVSARSRPVTFRPSAQSQPAALCTTID
ncbi:MAG: hypothetical protein JWM93_151 [Frankiales bacterium]|nr:hypothetical protein [Frankiales bacterium]